MWLGLFFLSIFVYLVIAHQFRPKNLSGKEETDWENRYIAGGVMILIAVWIAGVIVNGAVNHRGIFGTTQSYWYCWDTGAPDPHHLGHVVSGDHLCTSQELSGTGQ